MRLSAESVDRAVYALSRGPLEAHVLARELFPEREYPDLASARRAGHAAGRDLIARGVAVRQSDGPYALAQTNGHATAPPAPAELQVDPATGQVFERRAVGQLATEPDEPEGELEVDRLGNVFRVTREPVGRAQLPAMLRERPQRRTEPQPQPPYAPPPPVPQPNYAEQAAAWGELKRPEMVSLLLLHFEATFMTPDPIAKHRKNEELRVRMLTLATEANAWARALGRPELPFVAQLSTPFPASWPSYAQPPAAPAPSYAPSYG